MNRMIPALLSASAVASCAAPSADRVSSSASSVRFADISDQIGLNSEPSWKYGGPTIADLDGDGDYDFVLTNHHEVPAQLFENTGGKLVEHAFPLGKADMHGIAAGDYDGDGDLDLLAAPGGGNGLAPRPPVLLRNDGWKFTDVTEEAGLKLGARGRAVRFLDIDGDGDLDILGINAIQVVDEEGPRNIVYENLGGRFVHRARSGIQKVEAERVLVTDLDGDFRPDLVLFSPLSIWRGNGDFTFEDVTARMLPKSAAGAEHAVAVAEADIDNDGDFDLYVARGKTYYEMANNSLDFDAAKRRFDLRDEGNAGSDGMDFTAAGAVTLSDFWHWKRITEVPMPVFLGAQMRRVDEPADPLTVTPQQAAGFPSAFPHDGWYLGHTGGGKWRLEWHLSGDLAWGMRASVSGVDSVNPDFEPQDRGVPDLLLVRDGDRFVDASTQLPSASRDNNWGITFGDFDNDGRLDPFVYRFGQLRARVPDALFLNRPGGFVQALDHGATSDEGHGDMGAAFDWDGDGLIDVLSGDDDQGRWHLYRNRTQNAGNAIAVRVGHSPNGTDPHGALVTVSAGGQSMVRRIGNNGATHSQGLLNVQHFGMGSASEADRVEVVWRDGTRVATSGLKAGAQWSAGTR